MDKAMHLFLDPAVGFQRFSVEHIVPLCFFIGLSYFWIRSARKWDIRRQYRSAYWFSLSLAAMVFVWMAIRWVRGEFDIREDLPFHLCNILAVIFPLALHLQMRWFFGILYFWVLVGTMQAVITPDLKEPFPHFVYFRYWWVHCGLISLIIYGLAVLKWRIEIRDIGNAIMGANVYLAFSLIINWMTGGNYFFSVRKPDAATLLDYLGPWPWYLLTGQLVMLVFFVLYFLPVNYLQKSKIL